MESVAGQTVVKKTVVDVKKPSLIARKNLADGIH
jgi:hypothetical protein